MIKRLLVMAVVVILATAIFLPVSLAQTHMDAAEPGQESHSFILYRTA